GIRNTAPGGGVAVEATNSNLAVASAINTNTGPISVVANAGAVAISSATVSTEGGNISLSGTASAEAQDAIYVQAGVIDATVNGGAGSIDLHGLSATGRGVYLSDNLFGTSSQVKGGAVSIFGSSASAQGVQILNSSASSSTASGTVTITGQGPATAVDLLSGSVSSLGGEIKIVCDSINVGGAINSGTGRTTFVPTNLTRPITLGGIDETTALNLTNAELGNVTSSVVVVGSATTSGGIQVQGAVGLRPGQSLSLVNQGTIVETGTISVGSISAERLNVESATDVILAGTNNVGTLSGKFGGAAFVFDNAGPLTIGAVDTGNGVTGTSAAAAAISIAAAGQLNVVRDIVAGAAGNVSLSGAGVTLGPLARIEASGGAVAIDG